MSLTLPLRPEDLGGFRASEVFILRGLGPCGHGDGSMRFMHLLTLNHAEDELGNPPPRFANVSRARLCTFCKAGRLALTPWNFGAVRRSRTPVKYNADSLTRIPRYARLVDCEGGRSDPGRIHVSRTREHCDNDGPLPDRVQISRRRRCEPHGEVYRSVGVPLISPLPGVDLHKNCTDRSEREMWADV